MKVLQQYSRASPMPRKPTGTFLRPESMTMREGRHSSYFYGVKLSSDNCILQFNKTFPERKPNVWCLGAPPYDWNHESNLLRMHCLFMEGLRRAERLLKSF